METRLPDRFEILLPVRVLEVDDAEEKRGHYTVLRWGIYDVVDHDGPWVNLGRHEEDRTYWVRIEDLEGSATYYRGRET